MSHESQAASELAIECFGSLRILIQMADRFLQSAEPITHRLDI